MPTREEIMAFVRRLLDESAITFSTIWVCIYRLLLDYIHGVPRITDSNRLKQGLWRDRAKQTEAALAAAIQCETSEVEDHLDVLMRHLYPPGTQKMNPVGIAFACALVYLIEHFTPRDYGCKMEARIGQDVFPGLNGFRRKAVDIVVFRGDSPFAAISCKWGIRHDRVRDLHEEADTYKSEVPSLKFFVVTNEFDRSRLLKVLTYPSIDEVFHVRRDLVWQLQGGMTEELSGLRDLSEMSEVFP